MDEYYSHVNPGMGFANRNTKKHGREDVDFIGLLRLPIEFGGRLCKVGVFVKLMPDRKTQYLSLRFMEHESIAENIVTKKTEQLLEHMIRSGNVYELPGVKEKYGDIVGIEVEGFDEVNDEY